MFANLSKFVHVVVAGFNYRVNMADKAEIYDAKITSGLSWWDVIAEDIYGKTGQKVFAMKLISNKQEFCLIRIVMELIVKY